MEIRQLRYFLAVAEELSFSRAARRLSVAQPAISRTVQELEHELGVELLTRTKRSVALTPAGAVLFHETGLLLQRLEEAARRVRRTAAGEEGELRLGYIGPPTQTFLGRIVKEFRRRNPRVTVVLEERTPERVWEMVSQGRLTLGITRPVTAHAALGLQTAALRAEPLGVVVPAGHPLAERRHVTWRAIAREPLILLARREGMSLHDAVLVGCRAAGFAPRVAHTPSLIGTVLSYVEAGTGIGIVTDSVVPASAAVTFVPLRPRRTVPLVLVWHEDADPPPARRFRELLLEWKHSGQLWRAG